MNKLAIFCLILAGCVEARGDSFKDHVTLACLHDELNKNQAAEFMVVRSDCECAASLLSRETTADRAAETVAAEVGALPAFVMEQSRKAVRLCVEWRCAHLRNQSACGVRRQQ